MRAHWRLIVAVLVLLIGTSGCGSRPPASPDPVHSAGSDVIGRVTDLIGLPLVDVTVTTISGPRPGLSVVTGADGRFTLPGAADVSGVDLRLSRDGFVTVTAHYRPNTELSVSMQTLADTTPPVGAYDLTIEADAACTTLPVEFRTRTYAGSLGHDGNGRFVMALGGAELHPTQRTIYGRAGSTGVRIVMMSWEAVVRWLEDLPIVEKVGPQAYLAISGVANAALAAGSVRATGDLDGTISYCDNDAGNSLYFECAAPTVQCTSAHHRLTVAVR